MKIEKIYWGGGGILNYWLDSLDYGWERRLPYLDEISAECVHFENAYTFTAWTGDTIKNILTGRKTIDDRLYQEGKIGADCRLIQMLRGHDMDFHYYGFHSYSLEKDCCSEREFSEHQPSSLIFWEILKDMLTSSGQKAMYIAHVMAETHAPWLCPDLDGKYYSDAMFSDMGEIKREDPHAKEKCLQARAYADEQLRFYDSLLGDAVSRIYMSDHGEGIAYAHKFFHDIHHVMLMVRDVRQKPQKISSCFSYIDYGKLMEALIEGRQITDQIGCGFALIQGTDYCAEAGISNMLHKERFFLDRHIAYRGVVTAQDNYVLRSDGYERYHKNGDRINYIDFSEYRGRVDKLRKLAGREFPDICIDEKFQHSRAVWQVIDRYKKRIGKEEIGITMIKEYVDQIPEGKCIAIRGGGEHTIMMLSVLADRCKKIRYIADRNTQITPPLGIPVISPEELKEIKPDVVLISSWKLHKEFADEVARIGMDREIYDIYEELDKRGIHLDKAFYENRYLHEDFEGITV